MTYPPGSSGSPPPSPHWLSSVDWSWLNGSAVPYLLGRLVTQGEHTAELLRETRQDVREIKDQLTEGHGVMSEHGSRIEALEARPASPPAPSPQVDQPSRIERLIVRWLAYIIPAAVAWETGSIKAGLEALRAALK